MAQLFKNLFIICISVVICTLCVAAKGRDVTIVLKDNTQKQGELLLARDSVIALLTTTVRTNKEVVHYPDNILCIRMGDIHSIVLHKVSGTTAGTLAAVGVSGGVAVYNAELISTAVPEILIGFALGFLAGWMIQYEKEEVFFPVQADFWEILEYVRFEPEPQYISEFIDGLLKESR